MSQFNLTSEILAHVMVQKLHALDIKDTTQMKMQKLVYFALAWWGVLFNNKLINETPLAWEHGPVFTNLRNKTREFGSNPIDLEALKYGSESVDEKVSDFLDSIISRYGKMSASELRDTSHHEVWFSANKTEDQNMKWEDIIEYHKNHLKDAAIIQRDQKNKVWVATSDIIPGLVLEYEDYALLETELDDIANDLIKENCN